MSHDETSRPSAAPGFAEAVKTTLEAYLQSQGFSRAELSPQIVTFSSPNVTLTLSLDSFTHEIETSFALASNSRSHVSLAAVVEAATGSNHHEKLVFQAGSAAQVGECLADILELLKRYGAGVLHGDADAFERARAAVRSDVAMTMEYFPNQPLHAAAESAWRRRDFFEVKRLYESMTHQLTPTEVRRLEFARRHVK
ncbi:MAG: hypothetical protein EXS05_08585 [Planctomycetaceae bacterium]|nr:hypothetical protein [Planctomycetaceae bacterium]